jgi:hypothetical protein
MRRHEGQLEAYGYRIQVFGSGAQGNLMILRHPGYDLAIVVRNALDTDSGLFLLALSAFGCCIFAMATTTGLAHLKEVIRRKILGTSFDRASAERRVGVGGIGRGLKVDVIWVVAH